MIKIKTVLGILVAVLAIGIAAYFIGSKFYNTPDQNTTEVSASEKTPETQTNQTKVDTEKTPSLWSRVVAFVLLGLILIVVIVSAYKEKRGVEQKIPWKDIMLQPVLISVLGLLILNPLASLFAYNAWLWFWDHNILFWGTNMGIPILVHLLVKQQLYATMVASGMGILIIWGFIDAYREENKGDKGKSGIASSLSGSKEIQAVPAEVALPIICGCESSGIPGVIEHYKKEVGEDGKRGILRKKERSPAN